MACNIRPNLFCVLMLALAVHGESIPEPRCECNERSLVPIAGDNPGVNELATELARQIATYDRRKFGPRNKTVMPHLSECTTCTVMEDLHSHPKHLGVLTGKQLLIDDYLLSSAKGIARFLKRPVEHGKPVLSASQPWEHNGEFGFGFPGSVNHNGTHFLMHYIPGRPKPSDGCGPEACLKRLCDTESGHQNAPCLDCHGENGQCVVQAREGDAAKMCTGRNGLTTCWKCEPRRNRTQTPGAKCSGFLAIAVSKDGINWIKTPLRFFSFIGGNGGEHVRRGLSNQLSECHALKAPGLSLAP